MNQSEIEPGPSINWPKSFSWRVSHARCERASRFFSGISLPSPTLPSRSASWVPFARRYGRSWARLCRGARW